MVKNELVRAKKRDYRHNPRREHHRCHWGLVKSTSTVYTGGAIAAGSSIYGQRYEFIIQSLNYGKATTAMDCMLTVVSPLSGTHGLSKSGITTAAQKIDAVRTKLYQAQSAVDLKDSDSISSMRRFSLALVKLRSRLLTALNFLPSMATRCSPNSPNC